MSAKHNAQRLDRLRAFLRTDEVRVLLRNSERDGLTVGDADSVVHSIDRFFSELCSLDQALGVQLGRGENHPGLSLRFENRDAALRRAYALVGEPCHANSKEIADKFDRYYSGAWPRERTLTSCPAHRAGRIEGHLWDALQAHDRLIGWKQIQKIIETSEELKTAFSFPPRAPNSSTTVDSDL